MRQEKVLILGSSGLLGSSLQKSYVKNYTIVTHAHSTKADFIGDLTDKTFVEGMLREVKPDVLINLVALTNVDLCEQDPVSAYLINSAVVKTLTQCLKSLTSMTHLIHISTDMVYDSSLPSKEEDVVLKNYYSYSKHLGELYAQAYPKSTVLRTNFFGPGFSSKKPSFSDWLIKSLKKGDSIKLFTDVFFSPLSMETLASMLKIVIKRPSYGIYNLGSRQGMSKYDFALELSETLKLPFQNATKAKLENLHLPAKRPLDMRMDVSLFEKTFNVILPNLRDEIRGLKV